MQNFYNYGDPDKEYEEVQKLILDHQDAEYFNISFRYQLKQLPPEIYVMEGLKELIINYCYRFKGFPEEIDQLDLLKEVHILNSRQQRLPENLGRLKKIERLTLAYQSYNKRTLWRELLQLKSLKSLDLTGSLSMMRSFPEALRPLGQKLERLMLGDNNFKRLPTYINEFTMLKELDLGGNYIAEFPEVLLELPHLEILRINAQAIESLPKALLQMPSLKELEVSGKDARRFPNVSLMVKLFERARKHNYSQEYQFFLLEVLKSPEQINDFAPSDLLKVLNSGLEPLCIRALEVLEILFRDRQPAKLEAGARLVLRGKTGGKKSQLKQRAKSLGIDTGIKLNKATTHILIARKPTISWEEIQKFPKVQLLTENMLIEQLNELEMPYLIDEEEGDGVKDQVEHIRSLLHNDQDEMILLAFELLHGGGFPEDLLTDLFLVYKSTSSPKIRREALYFINQYGPPEFGLAVKRRLQISARWVNEATICRNLNFYCNAGQLDKMKVVKYIYKKYKKGISFALLHLDLEDKKQFFADQLVQQKLDLSGLGLTELPKDLHKMGAIKELDLSGNDFTSLPDVVYNEMKELEVLHIRWMMYLGQFPLRLLRVPQLKKVVLSSRYRNMPAKSELKEANLEVEIVSPYKDAHLRY